MSEQTICSFDGYVQKEYERLVSLGVDFSVKPTDMSTVKVAVFNDTCGNNIQLVKML